MAKNNDPVKADELLGDLDSIINQEDELRAKGLRRGGTVERMIGLHVLPIEGDPKGVEWWLQKTRADMARTDSERDTILRPEKVKTMEETQDAMQRAVKEVAGSDESGSSSSKSSFVIGRTIRV